MPPLEVNEDVILEVGGRRFRTKVKSLVQGAYFKRLFDGQVVPFCSVNTKDGIFHVDREAGVFAIILGYLERGVITIPETETIKEADVVDEAYFFGIEQLINKYALIVDREGGGHYKTISEALLEVGKEPFRRRVLVRPGIYRECVVLSSTNVEVIGFGEPGSVIVESQFGQQPALTIVGEKGYVRNISFRVLTDTIKKEITADAMANKERSEIGGHASDKYSTSSLIRSGRLRVVSSPTSTTGSVTNSREFPKRVPCIHARRGKLTLQGCIVSNQKDTAVKVEASAYVLIDNSTIYGCDHGNGIDIIDNGRVHMCDSAVKRCLIGIHTISVPVSDSSVVVEPVYPRYSRLDLGINFKEHVHIFQCEISNCQSFGIVTAEESSNVVVEATRIYNCEKAAVQCRDSSETEVIRCDLRLCECGVDATNEASISLSTTSIQQCGTYGISVTSTANCIHLEGNTLWQCKRAAVSVGKGTAPVIVRNHIHTCVGVGISIASGAHGRIEENDIEGMRMHGIAIEGVGAVHVLGNRVCMCKKSGIALWGLRDDSKRSHAVTNSMKSLTIEDNTNDDASQSVGADRSLTRSVIEHNTVMQCSLGISVAQCVYPVIRKNEIYACSQSGIHVFQNGGGTLEENHVYKCSQTGIAISEESDPALTKNRIHHCVDGLHIYVGSTPEVRQNEVFECSDVGIRVESHADPVCIENSVYNGQNVGISVHDKGKGMYRNNTVHGNQYAGIQVASESTSPSILHNRVYSSGRSGIVCCAGASPIVEDNEVYSNQQQGMLSCGYATPKAKNNRIYNNGVCGIVIYDNGRGSFTANNVFANGQHGVSIHGRRVGDCIIAWNRVHDHPECGILWCEVDRDYVVDMLKYCTRHAASDDKSAKPPQKNGGVAPRRPNADEFSTEHEMFMSNQIYSNGENMPAYVFVDEETGKPRQIDVKLGVPVA